jgi:phosphohistidine phosphatase
MDLYLIRHAHAVDGAHNADDRARPLTAEGRLKAQAVGAALIKEGARFFAIVSSPLVRAVETAELIAVAGGYGGALTISEALAPGGDTRAMLACAEAAGGGPVALVGHEPSLGALLSVLVGARSLSLSKGAAVKLRWRPGKEHAEFEWAVTPRCLSPSRALDAI